MWTNRQKGIIKAYQRYAGMPDQEYRALLHHYTGATSSTSRSLTQFHYDVIMPLLEVRAQLADANGRTVGRPPAKLGDWYYWRNRAPGKGKANTRELWRLRKLWADLQGYLDESCRTHEYLCGIASHACGRRVEHLHDLSVRDALAVIEALKDRLHHAIRRG